MTKVELVNAIAETSGLSKKDSSTFIETFMTVVSKAVSESDKVALSGFGVWEKIERPARSAKNPKTGEPVNVPAKNVPRFKAGKQFKDMVKNS